MTDRNDLAYWFPKLAALPAVRVPRTTIIRTPENLTDLCDGIMPKGFAQLVLEIKAAGALIGYPVFLRSGHTSAKHQWRNTCFVTRPEDVPSHIGTIVEISEMADMLGLPTTTWAVREYIPLLHTFTAFDGMPVAVERRMFVRDGALLCDHPYWPEAAIRQPSRSDWRQLLMDHETIARLYDSRSQIDAAVAAIAAAFDGFWSVDFAFGRDGIWYAIDMATGERSYHWPTCRHAQENTDG